MGYSPNDGCRAATVRNLKSKRVGVQHKTGPPKNMMRLPPASKTVENQQIAPVLASVAKPNYANACPTTTPENNKGGPGPVGVGTGVGGGGPAAGATEDSGRMDIPTRTRWAVVEIQAGPPARATRPRPAPRSSGACPPSAGADDAGVGSTSTSAGARRHGNPRSTGLATDAWEGEIGRAHV